MKRSVASVVCRFCLVLSLMDLHVECLGNRLYSPQPCCAVDEASEHGGMVSQGQKARPQQPHQNEGSDQRISNINQPTLPSSAKDQGRSPPRESWTKSTLTKPSLVKASDVVGKWRKWALNRKQQGVSDANVVEKTKPTSKPNEPKVKAKWSKWNLGPKANTNKGDKASGKDNTHGKWQKWNFRSRQDPRSS